jgi:hypothetical protein
VIVRKWGSKASSVNFPQSLNLGVAVFFADFTVLIAVTTVKSRLLHVVLLSGLKLALSILELSAMDHFETMVVIFHAGLKSNTTLLLVASDRFCPCMKVL